ncbi:MAG: serine hydrolase [Crocinitomicaceae bacterium]|jgi:CubicO group peptidase (beta-lactamase class C family)|nr:serine hydrolase [Crocinitomicaceae bacterium]
MKIRKLLLSALIVYAFQARAQLYFPPNTGTWDTLSPSTLNWCPQKIQNLYDYLDSTNSKAFIVLKDGKIVLEKYFGTFTEDSLHVWNSAGKTLVGFMTGIAQQEGFLNITDTTSNYLGAGWTSLTTQQEEKITIRHQLSMTTGMDDVTNGYCTDSACLTYIADAGTRWSYHNAPYTLMNTVISNATGQNFNTYISDKIGASTAGINGLFVTFGYNKVFVSKPKSFARFGLLLLAEGNWNGTPLLNDPSYFTDMTNSSQSINNSYGYLTWLNGKSNFMVPGLQFSFTGSIVPSAPADMYAALGKNGQIINVVPSQNLVMIRVGDGDGVSLVATQYNDSIWLRMNDLICTNSISENESSLKLDIFPNPSTGLFTIQGLMHDDEIRITNLLGKIVTFGRNNESISLKESGIYFIEIQRNKQKFIQKISIQ